MPARAAFMIIVAKKCLCPCTPHAVTAFTGKIRVIVATGATDRSDMRPQPFRATDVQCRYPSRVQVIGIPVRFLVEPHEHR